jgi:DHA2 family multidrug resistance protein
MIGRQGHFRERLIEQVPILNPKHSTYKWVVMGTVMVGTFMAVLDATIVNVALSKLMATFGVSVDAVEWILTAYLLAFAVMLPSTGWFSNRFGHKRMFLIGLFLFTLGSFLSSLSPSLSVLIAFRVIQGFGAGTILPVGMAIVTREFPPEKRGIALGFWSVAASASVSLGPAAGGYLIDHYSWHTIFDVNVPIGLMGMVASFLVLREFLSEVRRAFDVIGFLALALFLTTLLLALANGNSNWNTGGWTSKFIVTNFALSFIGLAVFLVAEFTVKHPLIELGLFRSYNFTLSNIVLFIFGFGMFGSNFLLPIYLQNSLGYTPFQAGMVFLPVGVLLGLTAPIAGLFTDRFGGKIPAVIGLILLAYTFYEYSFLSYLSMKSQIMVPLYIRGVALGLIFAPLTTVAITEMPNEKMAQASGLINVIRQVGGSFGVAVFGTLLTQRTILHAAAYGQQINQYSGVFQNTVAKLQYFSMDVTGGTFAQAATKASALIYMYVQNQAFISAIDDVFLLAGGIVLISVIPVFFLRSVKRKKEPGGPALE